MNKNTQTAMPLESSAQSSQTTEVTDPLDQADITQALEAAADGLDENEVSTKSKFHDWSTENVTVRTLIKRYQEGKFKLPLCQRLYVWNEEKRLSLYYSIRQNLPCGTIIITDVDNIQYLLDGLQRTTSLILLSNDKEHFTSEERKMVLDYKVTLTIVHDMSALGMKDYFSALNSGMALATSVKERSKLSEDLNDAILKISANEFFRTVPTSAAFNKAHHHELIAMNTLLAISGCDIGENKAKSLCSRLTAISDAVLTNIGNASSVIERVKTIYGGLTEGVAKRSMNANFIGILVYVMVKNQQFSNDNIAGLINYIFAAPRAVKEYSVTTSNGAGDANKCKARYEVLINLLNSPVTKPFDEAEYKAFRKGQRDKMLKDTTKAYDVAFEEFDEAEQKALYTAQRDGKSVLWNTLVEKKYKQLEQEEPKNNIRESV